MNIKKIHIHRLWQINGLTFLILAIVLFPIDIAQAYECIKIAVLLIIASELIQIEVILEKRV